MTIIDTIKWLKEDIDVREIFPIDGDTKLEVFKVAVDALEKQIPKNVVNRGYFYGHTYHCPICESQVKNRAYGVNDNYCRNCGQLLDWGEQDGRT